MPENSCAIRYDGTLGYPSVMPFNPDEIYPEFENMNIPVSSHENGVYRQVRQLFIDLNMDSEHMGTPEWSPLSELVSPGNTVVIKPNLVLNARKYELQEFLTTHPSVVRPIVDYCWKAMKGSGLIIIGDACSSETDFEALTEQTGYGKMVDALQKNGVNLEYRDFRAVKVLTENGVWTGEQKLDFEAPPSRVINLGKASLFADPKYKKVKLHGAGYDVYTTMKHHNGDTQEYRVSDTIISADVVISVPKLKTHRKAGLTCCLKNLVGINCDKNYLPHFAMGAANMGGDETPAIDKRNFIRVRSYNWVRVHIIAHLWKILGKPGVKVLKLLKRRKDEKPEKPATTSETLPAHDEKEPDLAAWFHQRLSGQRVAAGAWAGNETICRMILDLNRIFLCCDKNGILCGKTDRKIFYIIDGISMGMGNGPTSPMPVHAGIVAAGLNGYRIDIDLVELFGVDPDCITLYKMAKQMPWMFLNDKGSSLINGKVKTGDERLPFELVAPDGWSFAKKNL